MNPLCNRCFTRLVYHFITSTGKRNAMNPLEQGHVSGGNLHSVLCDMDTPDKRKLWKSIRSGLNCMVVTSISDRLSKESSYTLRRQLYILVSLPFHLAFRLFFCLRWKGIVGGIHEDCTLQRLRRIRLPCLRPMRSMLSRLERTCPWLVYR